MIIALSFPEEIVFSMTCHVSREQQHLAQRITNQQTRNCLKITSVRESSGLNIIVKQKLNNSASADKLVSHLILPVIPAKFAFCPLLTI